MVGVSFCNIQQIIYITSKKELIFWLNVLLVEFELEDNVKLPSSENRYEAFFKPTYSVSFSFAVLLNNNQDQINHLFKNSLTANNLNLYTHRMDLKGWNSYFQLCLLLHKMQYLRFIDVISKLSF